MSKYESLYFDTSKNKFFYDHHNGRIKRTKIRIRCYLDSDLYFLEVKMKDGRKNTVKNRLAISAYGDMGKPICAEFITKITKVRYELVHSLTNEFQRITLVNRSMQERVTIDTKLSFSYKNEKTSIPNLAIIEVKQSKHNRKSPIIKTLRQNGIHAFGFSKYCIGMLQMHKQLKYNGFKAKLLELNKVTS